MKTFRNLRVANLIEHELTLIIAKECEVEGALITVTDIEVSDDLLQAKVKLGIIPYEKELEAYRAIKKKDRELEHKLYKKINIRPMPHLKFEIDSQKSEK